MTTDTNVFMKEVRKLFPNATKDRVFCYLKDGNEHFCYDFGDVTIRNMPDKYHKQIRKINKMAKGYRKRYGFAMG